MWFLRQNLTGLREKVNMITLLNKPILDQFFKPSSYTAEPLSSDQLSKHLILMHSFPLSQVMLFCTKKGFSVYHAFYYINITHLPKYGQLQKMRAGKIIPAKSFINVKEYLIYAE